MSKKKIVVFGGSGFLGSHVCDKLIEAGYSVTIFDKKESQNYNKNCKMIIGDILSGRNGARLYKWI